MARRILWVDDEIHFFRAHIEFLQEKGYEVTPCTNGNDAITFFQKQKFDLVLLDEMMIGIDGIETLSRIRTISFNTPVIMITKNEDEKMMDIALSYNVRDFLTKPVNPSQILSALKKIFESRDLKQQKSLANLQQDFSRIRDLIRTASTAQQWIQLYLELVKIDLLYDKGIGDDIYEIWNLLKEEANLEFAHFIQGNYDKLLLSPQDPFFSHQLLPKVVFPRLKNGERVYLLLLDCMRLDQWLFMSQILENSFNIETQYYYSILPTATPYARNSIFSGKLPLILHQKYPKLIPWFGETETGKNDNEYDLMLDLLQEHRIKLNYRPYFTKILDAGWAEEVYKKMGNMKNLDLIVFVFNFLDIIIHNRTGNKLLQEIVLDESSFRDLARTWFENSWIHRMLQHIAQDEKAVVIITTDHGSIRCNKPTVIKGDSKISYALRFKIGNYLSINNKHGWVIMDPEKYYLPKEGILSNYAFANNSNYFAFSGNVGQFSQKYNNNFFHGGISMEEMILPYAVITPKTL